MASKIWYLQREPEPNVNIEQFLVTLRKKATPKNNSIKTVQTFSIHNSVHYESLPPNLRPYVYADWFFYVELYKSQPKTRKWMETTFGGLSLKFHCPLQIETAQMIDMLTRAITTKDSLIGVRGNLNDLQSQNKQKDEEINILKEALQNVYDKLAKTEEKLAQTEEKLAQTEEKLAQTEEKNARKIIQIREECQNQLAVMNDTFEKMMNNNLEEMMPSPTPVQKMHPHVNMFSNDIIHSHREPMEVSRREQEEEEEDESVTRYFNVLPSPSTFPKQPPMSPPSYESLYSHNDTPRQGTATVMKTLDFSDVLVQQLEGDKPTQRDQLVALIDLTQDFMSEETIVEEQEEIKSEMIRGKREREMRVNKDPSKDLLYYIDEEHLAVLRNEYLWLGGQVVNNFVRILNEVTPITQPKEYLCLCANISKDASKVVYLGVKEWILWKNSMQDRGLLPKPVQRLFEYNYLLFPVNLASQHWVLMLVMVMVPLQILIFDPLHYKGSFDLAAKVEAEHLNLLLHLLQIKDAHLGPVLNRNAIVYPRIAFAQVTQQPENDQSSCGALMLMNMNTVVARIRSGKEPWDDKPPQYSLATIKDFRNKLASELQSLVSKK